MKHTKYLWRCVHCNHQHTEIFRYTFDTMKQHNITLTCEKCGRDTRLEFIFVLTAATAAGNEESG